MTEADDAVGRFELEVSSALQGLVLRLEALQRWSEVDLENEARELADATAEVRHTQAHLLERATYFERLMVDERNRYLDLFDRAPDAYIVTSPAGLIVDANAAAATLLQRNPNHLRGKPFPVFVAPDERKMLRQRLLELARRPQAELELELLTGTGTRQIEARASCEVIHGGAMHIRWILRDVTARKGAEAEVRSLNADLEQRIAQRTREVVQASRQLESVVRELPVGVLIIDSAGELQLTNRRAEEFLGLSAEEIARSLREDHWIVRNLNGDPVPKAERPSARALASGRPVYHERVELELPNGKRFIMDASAVPVVSDEGVSSVVVTFEDVTEREQRERAERNFVTNAAHELQTPIAAITSGVQVLQAGAKDNEADRDRFLSHIESACARLDRLTRALLVLARAQAGDERPRAELVEVEPLLHAVASVLPPGAEIDITCPSGVAVIANRPLLEQALINLGANAVKYTAGRVHLGAEHRDGHVRLEVRDEGNGIDPGERAHVFDRFYRGTESSDGFGLGLAIVAEAVRAIDGELELESGEAGTGVSISLPAANIRT